MSAARRATRSTTAVEERTPIVERWHLASEDGWLIYARAFDNAFTFASAEEIAAGRRQAVAHLAGVAALEEAGLVLDLTAPEPDLEEQA